MLFIPDSIDAVEAGLIARPLTPTPATPDTRTVEQISDSERDALESSQVCSATLITMDNARFLVGFILLIVRHHEVSGVLFAYVVLATILDASGSGFNIFIRWPSVVEKLVRWGLCARITNCMRPGAPAIAKRELAINIGSMLPTIGMFVFGFFAFWQSYMIERAPANSMAVWGWITALVYAIKTFAGFPGFIWHLISKFRLCSK
jgi:hypothetical protein